MNTKFASLYDFREYSKSYMPKKLFRELDDGSCDQSTK